MFVRGDASSETRTTNQTSTATRKKGQKHKTIITPISPKTDCVYVYLLSDDSVGVSGQAFHYQQ